MYGWQNLEYQEWCTSEVAMAINERNDNGNDIEKNKVKGDESLGRMLQCYGQKNKQQREP